MLKNWQSHQEYKHFLHEAKVHFDDSQRTRHTGKFAAAREKLRLLNLDPVMELLEPYYPPFGRPAVNQTQILRSLVLMLDQGFTSITAWVKKICSDTLLAFLIGCSPDLLPPLGSYYDFIDRLWLQDKQFQKSGRKDLFPVGKNKKPANKPGKGKKLPNRHPEITKIMAGEAVSRDKTAVTVRAIIPILMPTGDVTAILELTILDIHCIYCLTMTASLKLSKKVDSCPCQNKCSKSSYGRCVYTKPDWDVRLYPPVARGTREYKKIYKNRTPCESLPQVGITLLL